MTAEIAVMNKNGIALAADSAVTVAGRKVYNSANKLFTLSKHHPVGVLIYGSADMNGIPWELIIKEFREQLKETEYDSVEEYGTHFQSFLQSSQWNITEQMQLKNARCMLQCFSQLFHRIYIKHNSGKNPSSYDDDIVNKTCEDIKNLFNLNKTQDEEEGYDLSPYDLNQQLQLIFQENRISISKENVNKILKVFSESLPNGSVPFDNISGIAIAGYGKKDLYPSIFSFETTGFIGNKLRLQTNKTSKITDENDAWVCPFAQREIPISLWKEYIPRVSNFYYQKLNYLQVL